MAKEKRRVRMERKRRKIKLDDRGRSFTFICTFFSNRIQPRRKRVCRCLMPWAPSMLEQKDQTKGHRGVQGGLLQHEAYSTRDGDQEYGASGVEHGVVRLVNVPHGPNC